MLSGSRVSDTAYFGAACDNIHNSFRCRLYRLFITACLTLDEGVFAPVREQVLEMTLLEEVGNLKASSHAVWGRVAMIPMELVIFGDIPLGV